MLDAGADTRQQVTASPGILGYALAVAIAHAVLAIGLGLRSASDPYWGFTETALLVFFGGLLPAAVIGSTGAAIVHFATRRASSQWPAAALAGLLGIFAGLLMWPDDLALAALLAFAAVVGRLAVGPLQRRRMTRLEQ